MPAPYPALAVGFTLFQTYHFQLAFGAMTETIYAFCLALGLLMMQQRRYAIAALALSWSAVTRLEGMPLLALFALFFVMEHPSGSRRGRIGTTLHIALLGTFPVAWNLLLFARSRFTDPLALLSENHFLTAGPDVYGSGPWYDYLLHSPVIHGPIP
jgi:Gpi18-like mannosyltransferase